MTLDKHIAAAGTERRVSASHTAIRVLDGALAGVKDTGIYLHRGQQIVVAGAPCTWLEFGLWVGPPPDGPHDHVQEAEIPDEPALFRLDEVRFGPGVCAYRHVHPGAGFRVLIEGELAIHTDEHVQVMTKGSGWFEPANSPVRAEASLSEPRTSFARAMVLPADYAGKPSIHILDPGEAALPRLQTTQRYVDQIVQLSG